MKLKIQRIKQIAFRTYVRKFARFFPQVILYLICLELFYDSVRELTVQFFHFNTTVLIRYETPAVVTFPAITICGCTDRNVICGGNDDAALDDDMNDNEWPYRRNDSVRSILVNRSFAESHLVASCFLVYDARRPDDKTACDAIEPPIASLHDGRKCFTYFTRLNAGFHRHTGNYHQKLQQQQKNAKHRDSSEAWTSLKNTEQFTWFIQLEINFTEMNVEFAMKMEEMDNLKLQDMDVIFAIHSPAMIPTPLDAEFYSLERETMYTVHISKQVNRLLPRPYVTHCRRYSTITKPRTQNECINLCLLSGMDTLRRRCANHNFMITLDTLEWYETHRYDYYKYNTKNNENEELTFCPEFGYPAYAKYVDDRRRCVGMCARDCEEENYELIGETVELTPDSANGYTPFNTALVIVRPDRKQYELIEHKSELDLFQFIGYLGGHAHIWLGLSAIQMYDVVYQLIRNIQFAWNRFVEW